MNISKDSQNYSFDVFEIYEIYLTVIHHVEFLKVLDYIFNVGDNHIHVIGKYKLYLDYSF